MRKRSNALLIILFLLALLASFQSANQNVNASTRHQVISLNSGGNCSNACWSDQDWSGTVYGASANFEVSMVHGIYNCQQNNPCWIERDLFLDDGTTGNVGLSGNPHSHIGFAYCIESHTGDCSAITTFPANTLYYTWGYGLNEYFIQVPINDIGAMVTFQASYYTSAGGGMMFIIHGPSGYSCDGTLTPQCIGSGYQTTYPHIQIKTESQGVWTGNPGSTINVTNNKWQCVNGCTGGWFYQTNDGSVTRSDNPPWVGWVSGQDPVHSSTGGEAYTCSIVASSNPC